MLAPKGKRVEHTHALFARTGGRRQIRLRLSPTCRSMRHSVGRRRAGRHLFCRAGRRRLHRGLIRVAAIAATVACVGAARAGESLLSSNIGAGGAAKPAPPSAFVLFMGSEFDRANNFYAIGFKARPFRPLGENRFVLIGSIGGGSWRETGELALNRESDSRKFNAYALGGAEFNIVGGSLGLFAGPEFYREKAIDPRGVALRRERRFGMRAHADWWSHPTSATLLTLNVAMGSAKRDVWSRVAFGWRIGPETSIWGFAGPEISFSTSPTSRKARIGAHWSEFGAAKFRFRLSGGASKESGRGMGPYMTLGGYYAF